MPRRKQDRPKRMKYSEDGKEEGEQDAATGEEEEEDDDAQEDGDSGSEGSEDPNTAEEQKEQELDSPHSPAAKLPEHVSDAPPPSSPTGIGSSCPESPPPAPSLPPPPPPPPLPTTPLPPPAPSERPTPLLPDEPLEELAERPLSSLENMSKAIEQKMPSVFDKYQSPRVKETVKLPYKPAKVIKEMPSRSQHSSSSSHGKSKERSGSSKGQCVPPSMTRHVPPTARPSYSMSHTPTKVYMETDQPLDLSKKPKTDSPHKGSDTKTNTSKSQFQYTPLPPANASPAGTGSSLSNLEKRFGGNSFLFDGTSGKLSAPKNPLYQAFGGNLFATALYNTPPLASTDQVYRPHYRNYWPGPIPAPRHANKPTAPAASTVSSNSKSQHHEANKNNPGEHSSRKEEQHSGAGSSMAPGSNGKYTNLICNCKKQFETLYELTIHMQSTSHTPLPCKNGDQGEYPKLVRGQDMWLNQGMEQTRQILRCMQCGESFKSLPELTIHMMKTRHYTNIVGAESRKIHKYTSYYSDNEEEERGSVFCCKVCHESFKDMDGLANHMVVSGHHKKHVAKTSSSHGSSGSGGELGGGHSSYTIPNHDSKSQSPKPAGIPVAPSKLAHSYRSSKSPIATVANLLESQRSLTNGTEGVSSLDRHTPDRKRKHSSGSSGGPDDWKNKLIKTEKKEDSSSHSSEKDQCALMDVKDYRKPSVSLSADLSGDECSKETRATEDNPLIKSEMLDSNDADDDDSMKGDASELNKIRCENCGERIETPSFVEHVRACVKLTPDKVTSPRKHDNDTDEEKVLNLTKSEAEAPKVDKANSCPHPLEYIPYKKRGRYEEAAQKAREQERPKSAETMQSNSPSPKPRNRDHEQANNELELGANLTKVKEERSASPLDLGTRLPYPERPKSQDVYLYRPQELERPRSQGSVRPASIEPLRSWSFDKADRFGWKDYPPRPRSNEEPNRPRSRNSLSRPSSSDAVLHVKPFENSRLDSSLLNGMSSARDPPRSPEDRDRHTRPSSSERHNRSPSKPRRPKSPVLHSTTDSMLPDLSSEGSALKAMENFIERSFITNSNKPSFYRSNHLNGRMGGLSSGSFSSRMECPLPDSTAQHVEAYSAQHKYLPPSLPTNLKVEQPESQKEAHHSPKVKVENETAESAARSNGKSEAADSSDTDARDTNETPPKALHQKYLADGGSPNGEKSSSALQSLQGLVYGKSFSTEHPLDSLQKLIHNTDTPTCVARPNGSQQTYVTAMATLQQQGLPSTVILVNPIVTVMPTTSTGTSAVHINISRDSSPPTTDQCSPTSSTPSKNSPVPDMDNDQAGDFRCQACNRTFASKGSYRYHLSRCHLSSVKRYGIKEAFNMSPYVYLPLDHTAKFNKYYEMANELANKGK